jgi:hypothetical protein
MILEQDIARYNKLHNDLKLFQRWFWQEGLNARKPTRKKTAYSDKELEAVKELREAGFSAKEIGLKLGRTHYSISRVVSLNKIARGYKKKPKAYLLDT